MGAYSHPLSSLSSLSFSYLPPFPSPHLLSPFLSLPFPSPLLTPSLPLEVGPLNTAMGVGSGVRSPSEVWGGYPAEIEFWCVLALKSDTCMVAPILLLFLRIN